MESRKISFTDKYPYLYLVKSKAYTVSTVKEDRHIELLRQIDEKGIQEFTPDQLVRLELAGFTVIKNE